MSKKAVRFHRALDQLEALQVVDGHQHLGSWGSFGRLNDANRESIEEDLERRLLIMDESGISAAFLHANNQQGSRSIEEQNSDINHALSLADERLLGGLISLPLTNVEEAEAELNRSTSDRIVGLTFHHRFQGKPLDHSSMFPICELAEARGLPISVHCVAESNLCNLWRLSRLARQFPRVHFLAIAAFSGPAQAQEVLEVAHERTNISYDTSAMFPVASVLSEFCGAFGAERVVFGSDLYVFPRPIYALPSTLLEILETDISAPDKQAILADNVRRLFAPPNGSSS